MARLLGPPWWRRSRPARSNSPRVGVMLRRIGNEAQARVPHHPECPMTHLKATHSPTASPRASRPSSPTPSSSPTRRGLTAAQKRKGRAVEAAHLDGPISMDAAPARGPTRPSATLLHLGAPLPRPATSSASTGPGVSTSPGVSPRPHVDFDTPLKSVAQGAAAAAVSPVDRIDLAARSAPSLGDAGVSHHEGSQKPLVEQPSSTLAHAGAKAWDLGKRGAKVGKNEPKS